MRLTFDWQENSAHEQNEYVPHTDDFGFIGSWVLRRCRWTYWYTVAFVCAVLFEMGKIFRAGVSGMCECVRRALRHFITIYLVLWCKCICWHCIVWCVHVFRWIIIYMRLGKTSMERLQRWFVFVRHWCEYNGVWLYSLSIHAAVAVKRSRDVRCKQICCHQQPRSSFTCKSADSWAAVSNWTNHMIWSL